MRLKQNEQSYIYLCSWPVRLGQPQRKLDRKKIQPGVWNIFPVYHGDHMMIHGGLTRKTDVKKFYVNLLSMIDAL